MYKIMFLQEAKYCDAWNPLQIEHFNAHMED